MKPRFFLLFIAAVSVTGFAAVTAERISSETSQQVMIRADVTRRTEATPTTAAKTDVLLRPVLFTSAGRPAIIAIPDGNGSTINVELTISLPTKPR